MGMVLVLLEGRTYVHRWCELTFLVVLMDELEFWITHTDMQTQERNHCEGSLKLKLFFLRQDYFYYLVDKPILSMRREIFVSKIMLTLLGNFRSSKILMMSSR